MDESLWTDEQKRAYQRALTWGEEQLLPPPVRQSFATWHAKVGHHMFTGLDKAFRWWSAEQPDLANGHPPNTDRPEQDDPHARMGPRGYALLNAPTLASPMEHYWAGFEDGLEHGRNA